ncbi:cell division cycle-associated protein 7-like [Haliotis asinina]|uniref:cell division cycle-associated protein 7-like n=1 Tax=Haliotis asinina TaxID=109174 RepID=UPI0035324D47
MAQLAKKLVSEYEALRNKNLADNQAVLAKLMEDLKKSFPQKPPPRKARTSRKSISEGPIRRNPSRHARSTFSLDPPRTRARRGSVSSTVSSASSSTSPSSSPEKMVVRFGFFRKADRLDGDSDELDSNMDEDELPAPVRRPRIVVEEKAAEDITDEDLDLVANFVSDKKYDSYYGSSCHQCRQKTQDMKTVCRSGKCFGVRGQFCGPCLRNRYGEDAKEALKNPNWMCPPCRGICNCSFCRKKAGKSCTGILIHLARENGFSDVNAYLQSFRK